MGLPARVGVAVTWQPRLGQDVLEDVVAVGRPIDLSRAHPARVYDRWLGGKDHCAADRETADRVARIAPWAVAGARASRAFLGRAVTFLATSGIRQYLDVGAGLPAAGAVHEVARRHASDARVCYVDNDPIVLTHARALLATDTLTIAVARDARDPASILADQAVRAHVDLTQPIALLLVSVLHFLTTEDDPAAVVATFRDALAPGSFVAISHVADLPDRHQPAERADATREAARVYEELAGPFTLRTPDEIAALFAGMDLVEPGLVGVNQWRPRRGRPGPPVPVLAGIGRIPEPSTRTRQGR